MAHQGEHKVFQLYARRARHADVQAVCLFQHAARTLKHVPYIGKIDDDTAPNLGPLSSLLGALRCKPHVLIGAINWAGVIPNAHDTGVRNDRCGFGWGMGAALQNFGTSFGTPPTNGKARGKPATSRRAMVWARCR